MLCCTNSNSISMVYASKENKIFVFIQLYFLMRERQVHIPYMVFDNKSEMSFKSYTKPFFNAVAHKPYSLCPSVRADSLFSTAVTPSLIAEHKKPLSAISFILAGEYCKHQLMANPI